MDGTPRGSRQAEVAGCLRGRCVAAKASRADTAGVSYQGRKGATARYQELYLYIYIILLLLRLFWRIFLAKRRLAKQDMGVEMVEDRHWFARDARFMLSEAKRAA